MRLIALTDSRDWGMPPQSPGVFAMMEGGEMVSLVAGHCLNNPALEFRFVSTKTVIRQRGRHVYLHT